MKSNSWAKVAAAAGMMAMLAFAVPAGAAPSFQVEPFVYLDPSATCDVQASWTNGTLFLKKGCATPTLAAAGADIVTPLEGTAVSNLTELNFDYRDDGHCGAGAPRFNIQLDEFGFQNAFLGCVYGTHTSLGNGWTHVEFSATDIMDAVTLAGGSASSTIYDLYIIFDEGTDTPTGGTIAQAGQVYLDNISVNNEVVGGPSKAQLNAAKDACKDGGWMDTSSKNQGQCVSGVVSQRP
jgi:hypothetical protein